MQPGIEDNILFTFCFLLCCFLCSEGNSSSSGLLEFVSFRSDVWLGGTVLGSRSSEVLDGFSGVLSSSDQHGVVSKWGSQSKLIESDNFSTMLDNTSSGSLRDTQSSNGDLRKLLNSGIIQDRCNGNNDLSRVGLGSSSKLGNRDWRSVDVRLTESLQHNSVELG
jgi:single-stranded DNA-specific DHH superfamily exonuclease